jgi:hypothetical protein
MSKISGEEGKSKDKSKKGKLKGKGQSNKSKKKINLLNLIPVRTCKWTRQQDKPELIRILKPRFDTKLGKRLGKKFTNKGAVNINLDEYGTSVWRIIDGKLTVGEIGDNLSTEFGDSVEPLYPRLAAFLRILEGQRVIDFKKQLSKKKIKKL